MMKKMLSLAIITLFLVSAFGGFTAGVTIGCDNSSVEKEYTSNNNSIFVEVEESNIWKIVGR